jgi:hypothetical protein
VGGLGGGVDDEPDLPSIFLKELLHVGPVPDIQGMVKVISVLLFYPPDIPAGGGLLSEEDLPHVVIDSQDCIKFIGKEGNGFGTD